MTKKKRLVLSLRDQIEKRLAAGISNENPPIAKAERESDNLIPLEERVSKLLGLINDTSRRKTNMTYFIMYDIENNKVRTLVHKYLVKKGCSRIQRSIFMADSSRDTYEEIKNTLTDIQSFYENNDSIIIVPISTDYIKSMKVIGQSLDIDLIMKNRSTMFF